MSNRNQNKTNFSSQYGWGTQGWGQFRWGGDGVSKTPSKGARSIRALRPPRIFLPPRRG